METIWIQLSGSQALKRKDHFLLSADLGLSFLGILTIFRMLRSRFKGFVSWEALMTAPDMTFQGWDSTRALNSQYASAIGSCWMYELINQRRYYDYTITIWTGVILVGRSCDALGVWKDSDPLISNHPSHVFQAFLWLEAQCIQFATIQLSCIHTPTEGSTAHSHTICISMHTDQLSIRL